MKSPFISKLQWWLRQWVLWRKKTSCFPQLTWANGDWWTCDVPQFVGHSRGASLYPCSFIFIHRVELESSRRSIFKGDVRASSFILRVIASRLPAVLSGSVVFFWLLCLWQWEPEYTHAEKIHISPNYQTEPDQAFYRLPADPLFLSI